MATETSLDTPRIRTSEELQAEILEARKRLARVYISELPAWVSAQPETPKAPYGADMWMMETETHIGYVYRLSVSGETFIEYRSVPARRPGRRHVYGCTAAGDIEFAGSIDSKRGLNAEYRRAQRAERSRLRHRLAPSNDGRRG